MLDGALYNFHVLRFSMWAYCARQLNGVSSGAYDDVWLADEECSCFHEMHRWWKIYELPELSSNRTSPLVELFIATLLILATFTFSPSVQYVSCLAGVIRRQKSTSIPLLVVLARLFYFLPSFLPKSIINLMSITLCQVFVPYTRQGNLYYVSQIEIRKNHGLLLR
jgi:hypothetical protein